ncbi:MAG: ParB/RepB/Spo0J family partition protein [Thermoleophilia bacterium]|nr:ParB/RepB/Spo0J family partition protein [Thermoleophilia bacterium]
MGSRKRSGLGRGLAELLGEGAGKVPGPGGDSRRPGTAPALSSPPIGDARGPAASGILDLPVSTIRPNPRQPRRSLDPEALEELATSIEAVGVVQPVIVRPAADGYELIAGERRWRAAQKAGFTVIPAILREASDTESLELALVENVVRQELNPVDEAYALQVLRDDLGVTQEALASRVGKSRSAIANKIRLLDLPGTVQEMLAAGLLSEGHGRALLGLRSRGEQLKLARRAVARGLSVRAVEAEVRRLLEPPPKKPRDAVLPDRLLDEVRERVYGRLEVMPTIRTRGEGGRIELPFKDQTELERLLDKLDGF